MLFDPLTPFPNHHPINPFEKLSASKGVEERERRKKNGSRMLASCDRLGFFNARSSCCKIPALCVSVGYPCGVSNDCGACSVPGAVLPLPHSLLHSSEPANRPNDLKHMLLAAAAAAAVGFWRRCALLRPAAAQIGAPLAQQVVDPPLLDALRWIGAPGFT
ncbi:hypothetical protein Taro_039667 [Colocasia esculenta]|uniref:Uncharacterized protein n=1 Tax=Colocasia esculenta TaxID=4460 RepID=A0A843W9W4_COLES|nr:hypothetical protein [Colocasia esculenta]